MKHTYVLLLIIVTPVIASAQKSFSPINAPATSISVIANSTTVNDTLKPLSYALPCYTAATTPNTLYFCDYHTPRDSGFITGTNVYNDIEKAQLYNNTNTITLTGCLAMVYTKASGSSATVGSTIKLYNKNSNGKPGTLLATSNFVPQHLLTSNAFNTFTFSPAVTVSTDFFVSYVLPNHVGDTTGIYSTYSNCNSTTPFAYEMAVDNSWGSIKSNWNFATGADVDLALLPLKLSSTTTAIITPVNIANVGNWLITNNELVFTNLQAHNNTIMVYDSNGNVRISSKLTDQKLSVATLSAGVYLFALPLANNAVLRGKFVITH